MYPSVIPRERIADGVVHILGLSAVAVGCSCLMIFASMRFDPVLVAACAVYAVSMMVSFTVSASYHLLPWHNLRQGLRRLDHAAIYALIAGTFTPLLVGLGSGWGFFVLGAVWALSLPAMAIKIFARSVDGRWSIASYLGLGALGLLMVPQFMESLPDKSMGLIVAGALFYAFGTLFYARRSLRFRYAIWHGFVVMGTGAFFAGICFAVFR